MLILKMIYLELCLEWRIHENLWKYSVKISKKINGKIWEYSDDHDHFKKKGKNDKEMARYGWVELNIKMKSLIYQNIW